MLAASSLCCCVEKQGDDVIMWMQPSEELLGTYLQQYYRESLQGSALQAFTLLRIADNCFH